MKSAQLLTMTQIERVSLMQRLSKDIYDYSIHTPRLENIEARDKHIARLTTLFTQLNKMEAIR